MLKKLAIITTHPIQYYAPVFKLLQQREKITIKVFYTAGEQLAAKYDEGFGRQVEWDLPLLDGYPYQWVKNTAAQPGSHHKKGIINPDLNKQITDWQADAVLVFGWAYDAHLKALRYFKNKIPVYFRGDSTLLDEQPGIRSVLKSIYLKWVYSHVDYAFYVGTNNKAYFNKYDLKAQQLSFTPHAIDNDRFGMPRQVEVKALRKSLNMGADELLIVFAGKFEPKKDPQLLLSAFLNLSPPNCHLLFVGNGVLEPALKQQAGQAANVHFMPFQNQSDMPVVYQAANLFCLPSKGPAESWGLAINEAMACGKAILASDKVGCAIDLVKNDYNGTIFKSGDVHQLQQILNKLIQTPAVLNLYGGHSLSHISTWNFTNIATGIEDAILNN